MEALTLASYKKIVSEANYYAKKKQSLKLSAKDFEKALIQTNVTIEAKKKKLLKCLHDLLLKTFSINVKQLNKKSLEAVKVRASVAREIIHKLLSINHYMQETVLHELGIVKNPLMLSVLSLRNPKKQLQSRKRAVSKAHIKKLEYTVYQLMENIIVFDTKLIKKYQKSIEKSQAEEKLELKDLKQTLHRQTEYLETLEEKIPPSSRITMKLFQKSVFNDWIPMVFGILTHLEAEAKKEQAIFKKIKGTQKFATILNKKIMHIIKEKEHMLHLQEKRAFEMDNFKKVQEDYRQTFHQYIGASSL